MSKPNLEKPINNIEEIVDEYNNKLSYYDWEFVSHFQTLSEHFIEKHKDKLNIVDFNIEEKTFRVIIDLEVK